MVHLGKSISWNPPPKYRLHTLQTKTINAYAVSLSEILNYENVSNLVLPKKMFSFINCLEIGFVSEVPEDCYFNTFKKLFNQHHSPYVLVDVFSFMNLLIDM